MEERSRLIVKGIQNMALRASGDLISDFDSLLIEHKNIQMSLDKFSVNDLKDKNEKVFKFNLNEEQIAKLKLYFDDLLSDKEFLVLKQFFANSDLNDKGIEFASN